MITIKSTPVSDINNLEFVQKCNTCGCTIQFYTVDTIEYQVFVKMWNEFRDNNDPKKIFRHKFVNDNVNVQCPTCGNLVGKGRQLLNDRLMPMGICG